MQQKNKFCASGGNRLLHSQVLFHLTLFDTEKSFDSLSQAKPFACSLP